LTQLLHVSKDKRSYVACGIDPSKSVLYRQSDILEISAIALVLGNFVKLGRLHSCTTFKERVQNRGIPEGEVSLGMLMYPVVMAADILAVRAERVPVGQDQMQHVEMTRDFARTFNYIVQSDVLPIPAVHAENPMRVPGIDGAEKMGKSDGNTINLLDSPDVIRRKVRSIPTQTAASGEMLPGTTALFKIMELCSPKDVHVDCMNRYAAGESRFFGEMKERLADDILELLLPIQERYKSLSDEDAEAIMKRGAEIVRPIAHSVLDDMYSAIGL